MTLQYEVRKYVQQHFPRDTSTERTCSCGDPNHARILLFRVNGLPASVVVPEGYDLSEAQLSRALAGAKVQTMLEPELGAIFPQTEMGRPAPFENPFGVSVYLDENLLQFKTIVFCPKMLSGQKGQCFRVPTADFRNLVRPVVVRLSPPAPPEFESCT
jgi:prolyl-tRNA editing enzyme YbaK/EbsC (Cys-tRNA(Pro) deacylase)